MSPAGIPTVLALASSAAEDRFDAVCSGTVTRDAFEADPTTEPWEGVFHIDLEARKYCIDACEIYFDVAYATPVMIVLDRMSPDVPRNTELDRRTGKLYKEVQLGWGRTYRGYRVEAMCEPASFSGWPATKF